MFRLLTLFKNTRERFEQIGIIGQFCLIALLMIIGVGRVYFHSGFPYTHDGENHLARFANYKVAVKEGQIPPRLAPNLLNHYTYPVFNYNYPLANILSLPGAFLKFNYEIIFKVLALSSLAALGIGVELWLKSLRYSSGARWLALISLAGAPFLINTVWFRGNIGELMSLALFPWALWLTERLCHSPTTKITKWSWWLAAVALGILLAHNIAALLLVPVLVAYGWWRTQHWLHRWQILGLWGWGILASLWFWLPALAEKSLIVLDQAKFFQEYTAHFVTLEQLLFSKLGFGFSYPGAVDGLSFGLGLGTLLALGLSLVLGVGYMGIWIKNRLINRSPRSAISLQSIHWWHSPAVIGSLVCLGLIWLQTANSLPIWQLVSPLSYVQFPWRLALLVTILVLPLIASWWDQAQHHKISWLRWAFLLAVSLNFWPVLQLKAVDYFHRTNVDYEAFSQTTSTLNENLPTGFKYTQIGEWQPKPQLLSGEGKITVQTWRGSARYYLLELATPSIIVEPSIVFAGFETKANGQLVQYLDSDGIQGRLAYALPAGSYAVETRFTQHTRPRAIGNVVSLLAVTIWLGWGSKLLFQAYKYRLAHAST